MNYFANQLIVVTGATGQIGQAIVELFHHKGARIIIVGRKKNLLISYSKRLVKNVYPEVCDFNALEQVDTLIADIEQKYGAIATLLCNAGIVKDKLAIRMNNNEWDEVIRVNLTAIFRLNRDVIKRMIRRKYGKIINIASIIGQSGNISQSNYAASKSAIIAMSKSLAQETARMGININCIAPGYINTSMTSVLSDQVQQNILYKIPMRRIGNPQDIAYAALFLASRSSAYITGHTLNVNGGMFM